MEKHVEEVDRQQARKRISDPALWKRTVQKRMR